MAPNAALRPFQMRALCSALWLTCTVFGSKRRGDFADAAEQRCRSRSRSLRPRRSAAPRRPADSPRRRNASQTWIAARSMNSMATGMMPAAMIADDAAARRFRRPEADQHRPRPFRRLERACTVASVTMPNWPSEPMIKPSRS